jgi:D-alanyl-D-alanine carboxypeptidase/D-alanyl-D-alanine-endopeptidase (penicillin-binding protein 4)
VIGRMLGVAGGCALCLASVLPVAPSLRAASSPVRATPPQSSTLRADLDRILDSPALARALIGVRVDSLGTRGSNQDARLLYERNADRLVMPASNLKIVTIAVAAETVGWDFRYTTRLEARGRVVDGTLEGDLIVTGSGDPSITSPDNGHAPLFLEWGDVLGKAGIRRIHGRIVGDDDAFDDRRLGAGWAWDYLANGYAAPAGALNYNENSAQLRVTPGTSPGAPANIEWGPPGHLLDLTSQVTTGPPGSPVALDLERTPGSPALSIRGSVPAGGARATRTAAVENPTQFFVEALRLALASRGVMVSGGAWDIDALDAHPPREGRRLIASHASPPLSSLAGHAMKVSQNLYAETFLEALARTDGLAGSSDGGLQVIRRALAAWGVPPDAFVLYDGSGLSRYNYVTASALTAVLTHVWRSERLRGPFLAGLPVAGRDGSLELRMRATPLERNVQAKTGTISNVRALSGYMETQGGEKLAFSMIANHYTAPNAEIDAVMEQALERLARE